MYPIHRFEILADRHPDRAAVVDGGREISYGELEARSNRLAHRLIRAGAGPHAIVCIHLPTGLDLVVAVLAAAKTSGAFLIIDPAYPAARKRKMLEESAAIAVVSSEREAWMCGPDEDWVDPTHYAGPGGPGNGGRPPSRVVPGSLAYLFYTSGSTGEPKAVMVPWLEQSPPDETPPHPGADDRHVLKSSAAFTLVIREIFMPLCSGGRLYLLPESRHQDADVLLATIASRQVTLLTVVPSLMRFMLASGTLRRCRSLRFIDCIGEALPPDLRIAFQKELPVPIGVTYGCTEAPSATARVFEPGDDCPLVDLGKPRPGRTVYLLDERLNPVPEGDPGQIYVSGQIATGYYKQPGLTAERFISDPFASEPGARMYRTGDRGRLDADGSLIYLGREDDQLQISGRRVEPAEVEKAVSSHLAVEQAAVLAAGNAARSYLVAFVVPGDEGKLRLPDLIDHCRARLPSFMVPSRFIPLSALPLLPSGKLDRTALLRTLEESALQREQPANDLESTLKALWESLFGHPHFGVTDDFFELGGDSLLAAQLILQVRDRFGYQLSPDQVTAGITTRTIAELIEAARGPRPDNVIPLSRSANPDTLFTVHGEGNIFFYGRLARLMTRHCSTFAIQAPGLDRTPIPFNRLEDCAGEYVAQVRRHQRSGPYFLGGYCFGGFIAFEMARQLSEAGHAVPLLVIMDADAGAGAVVEQEDDRILPETREVLTRVRQHFGEMIRNYEPRHYPGGVVLIQSAALRPDVSDRPALKRLLERAAGGFTVYQVDDGERSMFDEPCVTQLAGIVGDQMQRLAVGIEGGAV